MFPHVVLWWRWLRVLSKRSVKFSGSYVQLGSDLVTVKATASDSHRFPSNQTIQRPLAPLWKEALSFWTVKSTHTHTQIFTSLISIYLTARLLNADFLCFLSRLQSEVLYIHTYLHSFKHTRTNWAWKRFYVHPPTHNNTHTRNTECYLQSVAAG